MVELKRFLTKLKIGNRNTTRNIILCWVIVILVGMMVNDLNKEIEGLNIQKQEEMKKLTQKEKKLNDLKKLKIEPVYPEKKVLEFYRNTKNIARDLFGSNVILKDPVRKPSGDFVFFKFTTIVNKPVWVEMKKFLDYLEKTDGVRVSKVFYDNKRWTVQFTFITQRTTKGVM